MELMKKLMSSESGQGMAEYGLILALVAVVAVLALTTLGKGLSTKFDAVNNSLTPTP